MLFVGGTLPCVYVCLVCLRVFVRGESGGGAVCVIISVIVILVLDGVILFGLFLFLLFTCVWVPPATAVVNAVASCCSVCCRSYCSCLYS